MTLLGLRFENDPRCAAARFERLRVSLQNGSALAIQRFYSITVPGKGHSTLTFDYQAARDRGVDTRKPVLQHLCSQLLGATRG